MEHIPSPRGERYDCLDGDDNSPIKSCEGRDGYSARLAFSGVVLAGLASVAAHAETLNTDGFLAACVADGTVDQIEGVGTTVTPKDFCASRVRSWRASSRRTRWTS